MALLDLARTRGHTLPATDRIRSTLVQGFAALVDWNDRRRTRAVLSRLTAHELDDIGLTRADVDSMCRQNRF